MPKDTKTKKQTPIYLLWYYIGTFVFLCLVMTALIIYVVNKKQKPLPYYNSQIDATILNDIIALSITPVSGSIQQSNNQFTIDNFQQILTQHPDCQQTLIKDLSPSGFKQTLINHRIINKGCDVNCQLSLVVERLKKINQNVYKASERAVELGHIEVRDNNGNKISTADKKYRHISLPSFVDNTCKLVGSKQKITDQYGSSTIEIKPFHVLSAIKQFASSAESLMGRGNIYWCERYTLGGVDTPMEADQCHSSRSRQVQFDPHALAVRNPWTGLTGCIAFHTDTLTNQPYFLSNKKGLSDLQAGLDKHCEALFVHNSKKAKKSSTNHAINPDNRLDADKDDMAWGVPVDFNLMLQSIYPLRKAGKLYVEDKNQDVVDILENNTVKINDYDHPVGLHIQTTIVPEVQAIAQQVAECYTGNLDICKSLKINTALMKEFREDSVARRVGIAIVDANTGNIEALASSYSQCFESDHTKGSEQLPECPQIGYKPKQTQDVFYNYAFFGEAQPASTVKPIMTLSFLPHYNNQQRQQLTTDLIKSRSLRYSQRLFCERDFSNSLNNCPFTREIVNLTSSMGANNHCASDNENPWADENNLGCGRADLTLGNLEYVDLGEMNRGKIPQSPRLYYRYGVENSEASDGKTVLTNDFYVNKKEKEGKTVYVNRNGIDLNSTIGLGQGDSLVSPVGMAGIYAHIVNAAQGKRYQVIPHLVEDFKTVTGDTPKIFDEYNAWKQKLDISLSSSDATSLLAMMSDNPHDGGTGHDGCLYSFSKDICNSMTQVAGKTGTPSYKFEDGRRPLKWYAAAYSSNPSRTNYDKTMVVLIERNWRTQGKGSGKNFDKSEENNATNIAFSIIKANNARQQAFRKK